MGKMVNFRLLLSNTQEKIRHRLSRPGAPGPARTLRSIAPSLAVAALGTGALALAGGLTWRVLEREYYALLQRDIADSAETLAVQVELETRRLSERLAQIAQDRIRPALVKQSAERSKLEEDRAAATDPAFASDEPSSVSGARTLLAELELESEIADVALWRRSDAPASLPMRAYFAVNPHYKTADPAAAAQLKAAQDETAFDRTRLDPAFKGTAVISAEAVAPRLALVAFPGVSPQEVVVAHVELERLRKLFAGGSLVRAFALDRGGLVLAHADPALIGKRLEGSPFRPLLGAISDRKILAAQSLLNDPAHGPFFAGYRLSKDPRSGGVAVVASVPSADSLALIASLQLPFAGLLAVAFGLLLALAELWRARAASHAPPSDAEEPAASGPPRKQVVAVLHGSLRQFDRLVETAGPEEAADALNDYFTAVADRVGAHEGRLERCLGASFVASWELGEQAATAREVLDRALECVRGLEEDLARLNAARKVDGRKALAQGLGMDVGQALGARLGPAARMRRSLAGEVLARARALDAMGLEQSEPLLISEEVFRSALGTFTGRRLGEARLTPQSGLTSYYAVESYRPNDPSAPLESSVLAAPAPARDETSAPPAAAPALPARSPEFANPTDPSVDSSVAADDGSVSPRSEEPSYTAPQGTPPPSPATPPPLTPPPPAAPHEARWLINNGSQMVGPLSATQIAAQLFSQELDFDCQCWSEKNGDSSQIGEAGIFSGSSEESAGLWVYDGQMVHGPMTLAFLRTAVFCGAVLQEAYVCEGSTITGWKQVAAYLTAHEADTDSAKEAA